MGGTQVTVSWTFSGHSVDVPLATNLDPRGAGCPAWLRNIEPVGRGQNCFVDSYRRFRDHYVDPD